MIDYHFTNSDFCDASRCEYNNQSLLSNSILSFKKIHKAQKPLGVDERRISKPDKYAYQRLDNDLRDLSMSFCNRIFPKKMVGRYGFIFLKSKH